jgi:tetratricopeptide (TPR) repeat protein
MTSCFLLLLALFLPPQRWTATVSGHIADREGKPLADATIQYTNVGMLEGSPNEGTATARVIEGTGRVYKVKTDKKGDFALLGMDYGVYQIEITAPDGAKVYTAKKLVGDNADPNVSNTLNVDLSTMEDSRVPAGSGTNLSTEKKTKEQAELIRQENANAAKINRLIIEFHGALETRNWTEATSLLQELITLDANRWEFYQNLGTIQANQTHYQEAVQSFAKGVEVAERLLPTAADQAQARVNIADMLISEGDCYNRMDKLEDAVAFYDKAASLAPQPAAAYYRACNALTNHGKTEAAIGKCNQAIAADPTQWEFYQVLGGAYNTAGKPQEALTSYEKGVAAAETVIETNPDSGRAKTGLGQMLNSEGNLLVQMKRLDDALSVFSQATEVSAYPAMPYFNLCATYYNLKRAQEAIPACEKAISLDPTMSDAYYIKASILFHQGHEENGKYVAPPGTSDLLNKYLEYAPFGQHASAVRSMIDKLNEETEAPRKPAKPLAK